MSFNNQKPYKLFFQDGVIIIEQNGKKYNLNGEEIKDEPTTNQTDSSKDSSKKQPRSSKQS